MSSTHLVDMTVAKNPRRSTTYNGYLWKIEVADGVYHLVDLDEIAAYEVKQGRAVTILDIERFNQSKCVRQY